MTDLMPQRGLRALLFAVGLMILPGTKAADMAPDPIVFPPVTNVERSRNVVSESRTISGIDAPAPISVTGGAYSINGGAFTRNSGRVVRGDIVRVGVVSSDAFGTSVSAKLRVGTPAATSAFKVTTRKADTVPDAFSFAPRTEAAPGSIQVSDPALITGLEAAAAISVSSGGSYSIDGGAFTSAAGTVGNNAQVRARGTASSSINTASSVTVTIGGVSSSFRITTTRTADTTPDPFSFPPKIDAPLGSLQTSQPTTITGINAPSPISIVGGFYSVDGQAFTDAPGTVSSGASVTVQVLSSFGYSESRDAVLTVGGVAGAYRVTTRSITADGSPDPFSFPPQTDVMTGMAVRSEPIVVTGIDIAVPISVSAGRYQINDGAFTASPGEVVNGDVVVAEVLASEQPSTAGSATVAIGDKQADFVVTTSARGSTGQAPLAFTFAPVFNAEPGSVRTSRPAMITGVAAGTPISVVGGRYSVNGRPFTAADGLVSSNDSVVVEAVASDSFATRQDAVLTVGSGSAPFSVSTRAARTTPDAFAFAPVVEAATGSVRSSAAVTISGLDAPAEIAIVGGQYSIGGAGFTSNPGKIRNGEIVRMRTMAASAAATTVSATLTIGGSSAAFHVTTAGADVTPARFSSVSNPAAFPLLGTVSPSVTVSGISAPIAVSVSGGEYSINGGPFLSMPGAVSNGDRVRVMAIPGANRGDIVTATLNLGGLTGTFTVTSDAPADDLADIFEFRDVVVPRNTIVQSEAIEIRGINVATPISVTGGSYSINGGAFRSAASTVAGGDLVSVKATSASTYDTETPLTLNIGSRSTTWLLHTVADPSQLQAFTLVNAEMFPSGMVPVGRALTTVPIIVAGAPSPTAISVTGGSYSINGGAFTTSPGTVVSGNSVVVQFTAAASYDTGSSVTLRIGALSSTLSVNSTIDPVAGTPTTATDCTSHVYRSLEPVPLRLFVCRPTGWRASDRRSALMHWFGGGFVFGNIDNSVGEARYWASSHGMVGIAPDYRVNNRFGAYAYLAADDGRAALRWVQAHASELGIDPARIALSGSSAGGGVAFLAGLRDAPATGAADDNPLQRAAAIITRAGVPDITTVSHIQRFEVAALFDNLGPVISPSVNLDPGYPPVLMFQGDRDTTVAPTPSVQFCTALIRLGIRCDYRNQAGASHDLSATPGALDAIHEETRVFLTSLGLLPAIR
ncbi:alpha/beta hydrolase fold domain-containing protein [Nevskia sp.]|uniref:alpha/beta hydrolase fold domain-containing protein n=1 Tax=Nevskia sp. TaxID=1929292 RepID=UPI003F6F3F17